jgi:hypothetical protein
MNLNGQYSVNAAGGVTRMHNAVNKYIFFKTASLSLAEEIVQMFREVPECVHGRTGDGRAR